MTSTLPNGLRLLGLALVTIASAAAARESAPRAVAPATPAPAPITPPPSASAPDADIVVTARRRSCDVSIADRIVSTREFNARAAEWKAGRLVRVHVPSQSDMGCLTKIAFRLADRGVTRMVFLEPGQ